MMPDEIGDVGVGVGGGDSEPDLETGVEPGFGSRDWPPLNEEGKIPTKPFLEACDIIVTFFGKLGKMFALVRRDLQGNLVKLKQKYEMDPKKFEHIHDIILVELENQETHATESLLWLKRGLHFTCLLLMSIVEDHEKGEYGENLQVNCTYAYELSLQTHHPWALQRMFKILIKSPACPKRRDILDFLKNSSGTGSHIEVISDTKKFVDGLKLNLQAIFDLYVSNGLDDCKSITNQ